MPAIGPTFSTPISSSIGSSNKTDFNKKTPASNTPAFPQTPTLNPAGGTIPTTNNGNGINTTA